MRRRDVVKLVGWLLLGSSGSACLGGKAPETRGASQRRTVVIGAGLAGLAAARELRRNGHEAGFWRRAIALASSSFVTIAEHDPKLALVGLRIEIEKRLREYAMKHGINERKSLGNLLRELSRREILPQEIFGDLDSKLEPN